MISGSPKTLMAFSELDKILKLHDVRSGVASNFLIKVDSHSLVTYKAVRSASLSYGNSFEMEIQEKKVKSVCQWRISRWK